MARGRRDDLLGMRAHRTAMKPPFTYFGGKTSIAPQIAALLPAHEHYIRPFARVAGRAARQAASARWRPSTTSTAT